jgi:hypothetical protein
MLFDFPCMALATPAFSDPYNAAGTSPARKVAVATDVFFSIVSGYHRINTIPRRA